MLISNSTCGNSGSLCEPWSWLPFRAPCFMRGLYYHCNNLRFKHCLNIQMTFVFPFIVFFIVSSEFLKCRFLNSLLAHPMNVATFPSAAPGSPRSPHIQTRLCLLFLRQSFGARCRGSAASETPGTGKCMYYVFTDGIGTPDPNQINLENWCF